MELSIPSFPRALFVKSEQLCVLILSTGNSSIAQNDWKGAWWHSSFSTHTGKCFSNMQLSCSYFLFQATIWIWSNAKMEPSSMVLSLADDIYSSNLYSHYAILDRIYRGWQSLWIIWSERDILLRILSAFENHGSFSTGLCRLFRSSFTFSKTWTRSLFCVSCHKCSNFYYIFRWMHSIQKHILILARCKYIC